MKNWIRVTLIFTLLITSAAVFGFYSFSQINSALDNLSASYSAVVEMPLISFTEEKNTQEDTIIIQEDTATTTADVLLSATTSADVSLSIALPGESNEFYIGCTYQFPLEASDDIESLETALVDVETEEVFGPIASGLSKAHTLESDSPNLEWEVSLAWPGEYYISISKIDDTEEEIKSNSFMVNEMPENSDESEQEELCVASGGSL